MGSDQIGKIEHFIEVQKSGIRIILSIFHLFFLTIKRIVVNYIFMFKRGYIKLFHI